MTLASPCRVHQRSLVLVVFSVIMVLGAAAPARAGGAFVPPTKLDLGKTALSDRQGHFASGTTLMVGLNWATVYPKRTGFDIGLGYVGMLMPASNPYRPLEPVAQFVAPGTSADTPATDPFASAHGAYAELSMLAHQRSHVRSWVTGRAELMSSRGVGVLGFATRLSTELWSGFKLAGRGGGGIGVFALGMWAEMGVRELPSGGLARHMSLGLSGRIPLFAAGH